MTDKAGISASSPGSSEAAAATDNNNNNKVRQAADFLARAWELPADVDDDEHRDWAAKRRLAATLHRLSLICVQTDASADALDHVNDALNTLIDPVGADGSRLFHGANTQHRDAGHSARWTDKIWLVGGCNPSVPRLRLWTEGDEAVGEITFDETCVGAPGWAHGGMVAAVFDQICGYSLIAKGLPIVTGRLTVHYVRPTPLNQPMRLTAREVSRGNRTIEVSAESRMGDQVIGKADATFVLVKPGLFAKNMPGG